MARSAKTTSDPAKPQWANRIVRYGTMPANEFLANPSNPRRHPAEQRDALRGSFDALGIIAPVLINTSGYMIDGHARVEECLSRDETMQIPFIEVDLSPDEEALALASFDWITQMATYDRETLSDLLQSIDTDNAALQALLDQMAQENGIDLLDETPFEDMGGDVDRGAELANRYGTATGQIWQLGKHRLAIGDSTNSSVIAALMDGKKADICFTSPPYNLGDTVQISNRNASLKAKGSAYKDFSDGISSSDYSDFLSSITEIALQFCDYLLLNIQMLAGNKRALFGWMTEYTDKIADIAIWTKSNPQPAMAENVMNSAYEFIYIVSRDTNPTRAIKTARFRGTVSNVYAGSVASNDYSDIHGATFPLEFAAHFISNFSQTSVFDPFLGSGTTLIAAHQTGRICYGAEISPEYAAVCISRWETMTGDTAQLISPRLDTSTHEIAF